MNFNKKAFTTIFLTTLLTCSYLLPPRVTAQTSQKSNTQQKEQKEGLPNANRRRGAASRGWDKHTAGHLMALVPENKQVLTKSNDPKLLFHLPKTSAPMDVEFVIADAKQNPLYEQKFQTSDAAGIITVSVPESIDLKKDRKIRCYLSIVCNSQSRAYDIVVDGWIKRGEVNANYWQDALAKLAELRRQNPNDYQLAAKWKELLEQENLSANTLKIDRSFISRMTDADEDAAIVKTIIMLSDNLGMDVVAEGIETKSQQLKLLGLGAEYGQGFLFSKPLDSDNASKFLNIAKGGMGNRE